MDHDFYILDNYYNIDDHDDSMYFSNEKDIPDICNKPDNPLLPIKIESVHNIDKLLIFFIIYKLSNINCAFLQLPDFVSKHT